MKRKIIQCDICGKDITNEDIRYKFNQYKYSYFEFTKWSRLDMCSHCFSKLIIFVNLRNDEK